MNFELFGYWAYEKMGISGWQARMTSWNALLDCSDWIYVLQLVGKAYSFIICFVKYPSC